jgi:hypothetical protein
LKSAEETLRRLCFFFLPAGPFYHAVVLTKAEVKNDGWPNAFRGRYISDGKIFDEKSVSLEILGVPSDVLTRLADLKGQIERITFSNYGRTYDSWGGSGGYCICRSNAQMMTMSITLMSY